MQAQHYNQQWGPRQQGGSPANWKKNHATLQDQEWGTNNNNNDQWAKTPKKPSMNNWSKSPQNKKKNNWNMPSDPGMKKNGSWMNIETPKSGNSVEDFSVGTPSTMAPDTRTYMSLSHMDSGELGESMRFGHSAVMKSAVMKEAAELEKQEETPTKKQEQFWEIGVDWSNLEITHSPLDSGKRLGPDMPEGYDWSTPILPQAYMKMNGPSKWDNYLAETVDWSSMGLPLGVTSFWDEPMLDWTSRVEWQHMFNDRHWLEPTPAPTLHVDWSTPGLHEVFKIGSKTHDEPDEPDAIDWSTHKLPVKFTFWDYDLGMSLDWSEVGVPALPKELKTEPKGKWDNLSLDWSMDGIPRQLLHAPWYNLFNEDELVMDWSVTGVPSVFTKATKRAKNRSNEPQKEEKILGILPRMGCINKNLLNTKCVKQITVQNADAHAVLQSVTTLKVVNAAEALTENVIDFSEPGSPVAAVVKTKDLGASMAMDWSAPGLPHQFSIDKYGPVEAKILAIDWTANGIPWQYTQIEKNANNKNVFESVDWSRYGLPLKFNMWDNEGLLDWSCHGLPKLLKKAEWCDFDKLVHMDELMEMETNVTPKGVFSKGVEHFFGPAKGGDFFPMPDLFEGSVADDTSTIDSTTADYFWETQQDWSTPGIPGMYWKGEQRRIDRLESIAMKRMGLDDVDDLCMDWSKKGLPKQLQFRPLWDGLMVDWSIEGMPSLLQNTVHNERRLPKSKQEGIPWSLDWSINAPWSLQMNSLDWSQEGIPWELGKCGYSTKHKLEESSLLDWSQSGIPDVLDSIADNKGLREHWPQDLGTVISWNYSGLPHFRGLNQKVGPGEDPAFPELSIDWSIKGMPSDYITGFWSEPHYDWSAPGLPAYNNYTPVHPKMKAHLEAERAREDHYVVDWSKKGTPLPRLMLKTSREHSIDWGVTGIPEIFNYGHSAKDYLVKGVCYDSVDWTTDGMPLQFTSPKIKWSTFSIPMSWSAEGVPEFFAKLAPPTPFYEQPVDWSMNGIPYNMRQGEFEDIPCHDWSDEGVPIEYTFWDWAQDWSMDGLPVCMQRDKRTAAEEIVQSIDWSSDALPWQLGLPFNEKKHSQGEFESVNWGVKGLPITNTFWDDPIFDWSCRGLPHHGGIVQHESKQVLVIDWSINGLPKIFTDSTFFQANPLKNYGFSPADRKKQAPSKFQQHWVVSPDDMRNVLNLKTMGNKNSTDSPWNRGKDERRELKRMNRTQHTKHTKKALRILEFHASKKMDKRARNNADKHASKAARKWRDWKQRDNFQFDFGHPLDESAYQPIAPKEKVNWNDWVLIDDF